MLCATGAVVGQYRLYLLDDGDRIAQRLDLDAEADDLAVGEGRSLLRQSRFRQAELWQKGRRLGLLDRTDDGPVG